MAIPLGGDLTQDDLDEWCWNHAPVGQSPKRLQLKLQLEAIAEWNQTLKEHPWIKPTPEDGPCMTWHTIIAHELKKVHERKRKILSGMSPEERRFRLYEALEARKKIFECEKEHSNSTK